MKFAAFKLHYFDFFGEGFQTDCAFCSFPEEQLSKWEPFHIADKLLVWSIHKGGVSKIAFSVENPHSDGKQNESTDYNETKNSDQCPWYGANPA